MSERRRTVTNALLLALLLASFGAMAVEAGKVTQLSGTLLVKKADGTIKILEQQSVVEQGDVLFSEKESYARIHFIDGSELTLQPETQLEVAAFVFEPSRPELDLGTFRLLKGGVHVVTGQLDARSPARFSLTTPDGAVATTVDAGGDSGP